MRNVYLLAIMSLFLFLQSCSSTKKAAHVETDTRNSAIKSRVVIKNKVAARTINTKNILADEVVSFAETLLGIPYKYGSMVKENGFDCSGFINYVFNHYKINVPRTSVDFTNAGKEVSIENSKRGDLILFTGSDANSGVVGHMGIITKNEKGRIQFIHAASGRNGGVTISGMNSYFIPRFVKVIRVFTVT